jgi:hypothetical protein
MKPAKIIFFVAAFSLLFVVGGVRAQQIPGPVILGSYCPANFVYGCAYDKNEHSYFLAECQPSGLSLTIGDNGLWWVKPSDTKPFYHDFLMQLFDSNFTTIDYDNIFVTFQECKDFCVDTGSANYAGVPFCVHDEAFKMPDVKSKLSDTFTVTDPKMTVQGRLTQGPIAACIAGDGIYSCSQGVSYNIRSMDPDDYQALCKPIQGCNGRKCFGIASTRCGQLSYIVKYHISDIPDRFGKYQPSLYTELTNENQYVAENTNPEETQVAENNAAGEQLTAENSAGLQNSVLAGEPPVAPLTSDNQPAETGQTANNNNCDWLCGLGEWFGSVF